jgi:hypothetical protein
MFPVVALKVLEMQSHELAAAAFVFLDPIHLMYTVLYSRFTRGFFCQLFAAVYTSM